MVRGDPSCPRFCNVCNKDCRCEANNCGMCHSCNNSRCTEYKHSCKSVSEKDSLGAKVYNFPSLFGSEIIKVNIGKTNPQTRFVPKQVLIDNAEYFKRLFSFENQNGNTNPRSIITLDDEVDFPDAFDCFIQFCYWKDYYLEPGVATWDLFALETHARVYVFAERLLALALKALAVRKTSESAVKFNRLWRIDLASKVTIVLIHIIQSIYLYTPSPPKEVPRSGPLDAFRHLITALAATQISRAKNRQVFQDCLRSCPDFAVDLLSYVQDAKDLELDGDGLVKR